MYYIYKVIYKCMYIYCEFKAHRFFFLFEPKIPGSNMSSYCDKENKVTTSFFTFTFPEYQQPLALVP